MEYIISLSTQTKSFLYSLGFGLVIAVLYDALRIVRLMLSFSKIACYITDFFFSVASAVMTFLFCLSVTNGEVRLYIIFGELVGFFVFYLSFGSVAVKFSQKTVNKIFSLFAKIFSRLASPFVKVFAVVSVKWTNFNKKVQKKSKKHREITKKLLQKH